VYSIIDEEMIYVGGFEMERRNNLFHLFSMSIVILGVLMIAACKPNIEKLSDAGDINELIKALENKNWEIRRDAATALGEIRDSLVIDPLVNALYDENKYVAMSARIALVNIGNPAVVPLLEAAADGYPTGDPVFYTLAEMGSAQTVDYFMTALSEGDRWFRDSAGEALLNIGSPAVEPLIGALEDDNLADQAIRVLNEMDWQPRVNLEHFWYWARTDQFNRIVEIGPAAVPLLQELLDHESWELRMKAAQTLVEMDDHQVVETLLAWLNESDEDVRIFAANLLGEAGDPNAFKPILDLLEDETVGFKARKAAFSALRELGKPLLSELNIDPILTALAPICFEPNEWIGFASIKTPTPSEFYPLILLDKNGQVFDGWTAIFLQKWEPVYPVNEFLVACMYQRLTKVETCWYTGGGGHIDRVDNYIEITVHQAATGLEIADGHFIGDHPPECPLTRSPGDPSEEYIEEIKVKDIEAWLNEYLP
jgi:HEAT repeat protein